MRGFGVLKSWRLWRRLTQMACLAAFLWLFRRTATDGIAPLSGWENILFRLDPLTAASAVLGGKILIALLWPALVLAILTLLLGRFFCGWMCPLGTLLDLFHRALRPITRWTNRPWTRSAACMDRSRPSCATRARPIRYVLLILVLTGALLGVQWVGFVNPFSLLMRAMTFCADPMFYAGANRGSGWLLDHGPAWVTRFSEPAYAWMRDHVLPFDQKHYALVGTSLALLLAIFALELVARRFWCRYLCPSGALLGVLSRNAIVRRLPVAVCKGCPAHDGDCGQTCRMGAFTQDQRLVPEDCNLCMDCVVDCPREVARFSLRKRRRKVPAAVAAPSSRSPSSPDQPVPQESRSPKAPHTGFAGLQMSRRAFVGAVGAGVAVPLVLHAARTGMHSPPDEHFLRPPGAQDETRLLDLCVRCGQCMKVCPNNALQPSLLQGGIEGMFVPHLVPRIGYCEYDCTLCGQVCPTGAIPNLIQQQKHKAIIGKAVLNQDLCLPWAENQECICCEEHCPVDEKAIQYDVVDVTDATGQRVTIQRPYVIVERCVGCGICENVCPVDGEAAIRVQREQTVTAEDSGRGRMIRRRFRGGRGA